VTVTLPVARLEPADAECPAVVRLCPAAGLLDRIGNFFAGNPNSQQQV